MIPIAKAAHSEGNRAPASPSTARSSQGLDERPTIALFIPTLGVGGAERQVLQLARNLPAEKWRVLLLTLDDRAVPEAESANVRHVPLAGVKGGGAVRRLVQFLATERVDVLQAFLLGAQVYALAAAALRRNVKLIAAVRASMGLREIVGWKGKISHTLVFGLTPLVDRYVFNSSAGVRALGRHLSERRKMVIPNGIDTDRFRPRHEGRSNLCELATIPPGAMIVGMLANVNVDKGFETFVRAAAVVAREIPPPFFVVVGEHRNPLGERIQALIAELSLTSRFRFLGSRDDVEMIVSGMDVLCSASSSEGFSNSIAEAMAAGVPCVVTDVGDSGLIVGNTGVVVHPNDAVALAGGLRRLLALEHSERRKLGQSARERIESLFGIRGMVERYEVLYETLLRERLTSK
jgi:glycosyltransferase involved in cell wall biosynthesis